MYMKNKGCKITVEIKHVKSWIPNTVRKNTHQEGRETKEFPQPQHIIIQHTHLITKVLFLQAIQGYQTKQTVHNQHIEP